MRALRELIEKLSGYNIYKKGFMPAGGRLNEDIDLKLKIDVNVVFDVGANIGQTVESFKTRWPEAYIHSFEPINTAFEQLKKLKYDRVIYNNMAVGNFNGEQEIIIYPEDSSVLNSLKPNLRPEHSNNKQTVQVIEIDRYVESQNIKIIDLLKIDTEGFELEVLEGAKNTLQNNNVKLILAEVGFSVKNQRNTNLADVIKYLDEFDYTLYNLYEPSYRNLKTANHYANALFLSSQI